jgi:hypothetical protein
MAEIQYLVEVMQLLNIGNLIENGISSLQIKTYFAKTLL